MSTSGSAGTASAAAWRRWCARWRGWPSAPAHRSAPARRWSAWASIGAASRRSTPDGVLRAGERIGTSVVVANADPALVLGGLVKEARRREAAPSMSAWTAILKARRREGRAAHTVLFPRDYAAEFRDIFDRDRIPVEPTVYLCAQERAHGRVGWAEHEAIFTMVNAPAVSERMDERRDEKARTAEVVRQRLRAARLIDDDYDFVWTRSPSELASQFLGSRGAIYGSSSNGRTSAFLRPPNVVPEVRGLYLASGGAHPGGGMPLAATSGRLAARAALRAGFG